jgi:hypothetical protein
MKKWSDRDGGICPDCGQIIIHFREIDFIGGKVRYIKECTTCHKQWIRYERVIQPSDKERYYNRFFNKEEHNRFMGKPRD